MGINSVALCLRGKKRKTMKKLIIKILLTVMLFVSLQTATAELSFSPVSDTYYSTNIANAGKIISDFEQGIKRKKYKYITDADEESEDDLTIEARQYYNAVKDLSYLYAESGDISNAIKMCENILSDTNSPWNYTADAQAHLIEIRNFTASRDEDYYCGLRALNAALNYKTGKKVWGMAIGEEKPFDSNTNEWLYPLRPPRNTNGYSMLELRSFTIKAGFSRSQVYKMSWEQLKKMPDSNFPLVAYCRGGADSKIGHFMTILGIEDDLVDCYENGSENTYDSHFFLVQWAGYALGLETISSNHYQSIINNSETAKMVGAFDFRHIPPNYDDDRFNCINHIYGADADNEEFTDGNDDDDDKGMPIHKMNTINLNVRVSDTPFWYQPVVGPKVEVQFIYNLFEKKSSICTGNKWFLNYDAHFKGWSQEIEVQMPSKREDTYLWRKSGKPNNSNNSDKDKFYYKNDKWHPADGKTRWCQPTKGVLNRAEKIVIDDEDYLVITTFESPLNKCVDSARRKSKYYFDKKEKVLRFIEDKNGHRVTLIRADEKEGKKKKNRILKIVDALEQETHFEYSDDNGFLTKITGPMGREVKIDYLRKQNGKLRKLIGAITDMAGYKSYFVYRGRHKNNRSSTADILYHVPYYNLFIGEIIRPDGCYSFNYNVVGYSVSEIVMTDPIGTNETYKTVGSTKVIFTAPNGVKTIYKNNDYRIINIKKFEGSDKETKKFTYKNKQIIKIEKFWKKFPKDEYLTSTYEYDFQKRTKNIVNPAGNTTAFVYNDKDDCTKITMAKGTDDETSMSYSYDSVGNLKTITAPIVYEDDPKNITEIDYYLDGLLKGRIKSVMDPLQRKEEPHEKTLFEYEIDDNVKYPVPALVKTVTKPDNGKEFYEYDMAGRIRKFTTYGANNQELVSEFVWDDLDRITLITPPTKNKVVNLYSDSLLKVVEIVDSIGRFTRFTYDARERTTSTRNPAGYITSNVYDAVNMIKTIDARGNASLFNYDYEYIKRGKTKTANGSRLRSSTTPPTFANENGAVTKFEYNAKGEVINAINPRGINKVTEYTKLGKPDFIYLKDKDNNVVGNSVDYEYDGLGRVIKTTENNVGIYETSYDELSRPINFSFKSGDNDYVDYTIENRYNVVGLKQYHIIKVGDNFIRTDYEYDTPMRRLIKVETRLSEDKSTPPFATADYDYYDKTEQLKTKTYSNGDVTSYFYDEFDRLSEIKAVNKNSENLMHYTYEYDPKTEMIRVIRDFVNKKAALYKYDIIDQLTAEIELPLEEVETPAFARSLVYDPAGNLKTNRFGKTRQKHEHTPANELTKIEVDNTGQNIETVGQLTGPTAENVWNIWMNDYLVQILSKQPKKVIFAGNIKFDSTEESQFVSVTATGARLNNVKRKEFTINTADIPTDTEAVPAQMTYDENGNMLTLTENDQTTTYEYDFRDMLTKITGSDYSREYKYSADGLRLKAVEDGNTRYFIQLDPGGNAIELKKEDGKFKIVKLRGVGEYDFEEQKNYYFHRNHRGDIVNVTDQNGDSVAKFTYEAFGKTTAEGTLKDKFRIRFSSQEWNEKSKLYYYGFRYYSPKLKRWT